MTTGYDQYRTSLGAYVLGALGTVDRDEIESHLATCSACRDELAELAGLPGLLGLLSEKEIVALETPELPKINLEKALSQVKQRNRRRRRSILAAAIIAAAVVAGGFITTQHLGSPNPSRISSKGTSLRVSATNASSGVRATAILQAETWGTQIRLSLSGVTPNEHCQLLAIAKNGSSEVAGGWRVTYRGQANINGATAIQRSNLATLKVTTDTGENLITLHPT